MILSNAFFKLALGADVRPSQDYVHLSNFHKIGAEVSLKFPSLGNVHFSRIILSGLQGGAATFNGTDYTHTVPRQLGRQQKNSWSVDAPLGAVADEIIDVYFRLDQSYTDRLYKLPLLVRKHTSAALINRALYEVLAADPVLAVDVKFAFNDVTGNIEYTKVYAEANAPFDGGPNEFVIALDTGPYSDTRAVLTTGIAGYVIQKMGGTGTEMYSTPPAASGVKALYLSCPPESSGSVTTSEFGILAPGSYAGKGRASGAWPVTPMTLSCNRGILDIIQIS